MQILIAEDDPTSLNILSALLKKAGYEPVVTSNGIRALYELQKPDAPKLAILDWMIPGIDGIEVVRRIRNLRVDQPPYILILTVRGEKVDIVAGLDAGADDYLSKPFDPDELKARVDVGRRIVELQDKLREKIRDLHSALAEIKTLRGIVPICVSCKKIRDDSGFWRQVEIYVRDHSEADFSHCICPDCAKIMYADTELNDS